MRTAAERVVLSQARTLASDHRVTGSKQKCSRMTQTRATIEAYGTPFEGKIVF